MIGRRTSMNGRFGPDAAASTREYHHGASHGNRRSLLPGGRPAGLSRWYAQHLGVGPPPESYDQGPWEQEAGPTVIAPFPADSDYFRRPTQQWAINFRVRDLDAMVAQLRSSGIEVQELAGRGAS